MESMDRATWNSGFNRNQNDKLISTWVTKLNDADIALTVNSKIEEKTKRLETNNNKNIRLRYQPRPVSIYFAIVCQRPLRLIQNVLREGILAWGLSGLDLDGYCELEVITNERLLDRCNAMLIMKKITVILNIDLFDATASTMTTNESSAGWSTKNPSRAVHILLKKF